MQRSLLIALALFLNALINGQAHAAAELPADPGPSADRPNVLFISIDDLNDWIGALKGHPQAKTPHLDRLLDQSVVFTNAHCAAPVCSASRHALLSGLRPSTTGWYANSRKNRANYEKVLEENNSVPLPTHFKRNGYTTLAAGKIFHSGTTDVPGYDYWTEARPKFKWTRELAARGHGYQGQNGGHFHPFPPDGGAIYQKYQARVGGHSLCWGALGKDDMPAQGMPDEQIARWTVDQLKQKHNKPFFLAVGFVRPHVPYTAPKEFFDLYPPGETIIPRVPADEMDDIPLHGKAMAYGYIPGGDHWNVLNIGPNYWRELTRAYLACVSFVDAQVGKVLDALEKSPHAGNTIIVLWSDHGQHPGEKRHWRKQALWEESTRVPLAIHVPKTKQPGSHCSQPVSLIDLYPTLVELAGLPKVAGLEGESLMPLLKDVDAVRSAPAVTTWHYNNHAVRSDRWRYIRYRDGSEELYDHQNDPGEHNNLASKTEFASVKERLKQHLPKVNVMPDALKQGRQDEHGGKVLYLQTEGVPAWLGKETVTNQTRKPTDKPQRPNIVFVLADDLGFGDVKSFGGERCQIETPHFDRLAKEGMRFTHAYAIASVCIPSRVGIMTGRYAFRFGRAQPGGPWGFLGPKLKTDQFTVARMLQDQGYRTGYVGKWHLGTRMVTRDGKIQGLNNVDYTKPVTIGAQQYGFDESFILPGSLDMYPYAYLRNNEWVGEVTATKGWSAFNRRGPAEKDFEDYEVLGTFATEAERFIMASKEKPFFLYVALTAPHTPTSPTNQFKGKSKAGLYGDFVMNTDDTLGRVIAALEKAGVADNTLIIASSDHGPAPYAGDNPKATFLQMKELEKRGHYASGPFRGYKFSVYEGAFRVPFVVRWPGNIKASTTCTQPIGLLDLMGTLAEITDAELAEDQGPDSISFLPLMKDPQAEGGRNAIYLEGTRGNAFRQGDWKIAFCPGSGASGHWGNTPKSDQAWRDAVKTFDRNPQSHEDLAQAPFVQLYNLKDDPGETTNLAPKHPQRVKDMIAAAKKIIADGRSTPGKNLPNDYKPDPNVFRVVPGHVWKK